MSKIETSDNSIYTLMLITAYNESSEQYFTDLQNLIDQKYPLVKLIGYHENKLKERKKAFGIKGGYGAKLAPFSILLDMDKNPIKAFYTEVEECTVDNIQNELDSFLMSNIEIMDSVKIKNISNNPLPKYETSQSAGMDIRVDFSRVSANNPIKIWGNGEVMFGGENNKKTLLKLEPGSRALLPTGIFTTIPEGYEAQLRPRSGLAIKTGLNLINCLGTIDAKLIYVSSYSIQLK